MNAALTNGDHVSSSRHLNSKATSHSTSDLASGEMLYRGSTHRPSDQPSDNYTGDIGDSMNAFDSIEVSMDDGDAEEQSSFVDNGVQ